MNLVLYQTVVIASLLLIIRHVAYGGPLNPTPSNANLNTTIGNAILQFVTVGDYDMTPGHGTQS